MNQAKKDNKKFGIFTFFNVKNYGALLQAFALQNTINKYGFESEFINFADNNEENNKRRNFKTYIKLLFNINFAIFKFIKTRGARKKNELLFENFRKNYFKINKKTCYDIEDLKYIDNEYKGFVTGSDMVWTDIGQNLDVYFLKFTDYNKRISYAPSLTGTSSFDDDKNLKMRDYIDGIKYLSFREKEGIEYSKKITNRDATWAVDPTLLLTKDEWQNAFRLKEHITKNKYILCYMFEGVQKKVYKKLDKIAKKKGWEIRYIPMNIKEYYSELKLGYSGAYGPKEFVELFFNAEFIVTNSFHGLLFSIIAHKPFVVFHRDNSCRWKANEERMTSILKMINCENRFIQIDSNIEEWQLEKIATNNNLICNINKSKEYLKNALESVYSYDAEVKKNNEFNNIMDVSKKQCSGCLACKQVCPKQCIEIIENDEGFCYPIVNENECIKCKKCINRCPAINHVEMKKPLYSKVIYSKDKEKINSASGGLFYTISKYFIKEMNGIVFGVVLDEKLNCIHKSAKNIEELKPMQNSKYIQSYIGNTYQEAKKYLDENKFVLFSGTPCQIAGLRSFLNKDYENLYTIDIICHGVPSPLYWKKYIENNSKNGKIINYKFRNKDNIKEKRSAYEAIIKKENKIIKRKNNEDEYYNPFIKGESYRMSCYYCKYANIERCGDFTIGDCDSWKKYKDFGINEVKSTLLINNEKAYKFFNSIQDKFEKIDLNLKDEMDVNTPLSKPTQKPPARERIYKDLKALTWNDFCKKYTYKPKFVRVKKTIKSSMKRIIK